MLCVRIPAAGHTSPSIHLFALHGSTHVCVHPHTYTHTTPITAHTCSRIFSRRPSRLTRFLADTCADNTSPVYGLWCWFVVCVCVCDLMLSLFCGSFGVVLVRLVFELWVFWWDMRVDGTADERASSVSTSIHTCICHTKKPIHQMYRSIDRKTKEGERRTAELLEEHFVLHELVHHPRRVRPGLVHLFELFGSRGCVEG